MTDLRFDERDDSLLDRELNVNIEVFIRFLQMMGFGLASWAYSKEEMLHPDTLSEIEHGIAHMMQIPLEDAKDIAKLLVRYAHSFTNEELEPIRELSRPHSLTQLLNVKDRIAQDNTDVSSKG